jgi:hypothetical protein
MYFFLALTSRSTLISLLSHRVLSQSEEPHDLRDLREPRVVADVRALGEDEVEGEGAQQVDGEPAHQVVERDFLAEAGSTLRSVIRLSFWS